MLRRTISRGNLFLDSREMHKVLHGDRAAARRTGIDRRGRPSGEIVDIVEHPRPQREAIVRVVEPLGRYTDPRMEIAIVLRKHDPPHEFALATRVQGVRDSTARAFRGAPVEWRRGPCNHVNVNPSVFLRPIRPVVAAALIGATPGVRAQNHAPIRPFGFGGIVRTSANIGARCSQDERREATGQDGDSSGPGTKTGARRLSCASGRMVPRRGLEPPQCCHR